MPQSVISEHFTITPESLTKQGISGQNKGKQNYDKSIFHLPRQHLPKHNGAERDAVSGESTGNFRRVSD